MDLEKFQNSSIFNFAKTFEIFQIIQNALHLLFSLFFSAKFLVERF